MKNDKKLSVSISFEEIRLPPFEDILILGSKCPHGRVGVSKCLNLLSPDSFELINVEDSLVEAVLVNKKILKRMSRENVVKVLKERVFPYITKGEIVKVDFKVTVAYEKIDIKPSK
jgi:hypothetical protein